MADEVKVLLFRGTGAPLTGDGILNAYADGLGDWADIQYVNYPASYGSPSYDISIHKGVAMGLDALRATAKPAIVMGFSQAPTSPRTSMHYSTAPCRMSKDTISKAVKSLLPS